MIKLNHVTSIALATLVVLAVAAVMAYRQVALTRYCYRAEVAMQETLADVRQLQIATRALQSERADFAAIRHDWEEARDSFPRQLKTLEASLGPILPDQPQLRRIRDTWGRMETAHGQVSRALTQLKEGGVLAQVGTRSLVLSYQEMLLQPGTPDPVIGEIGLLLFQLEQTDRMVLEIEFELRDLARNLEVRTSLTVRNSLTAVAVVLGIATVLVVGLLIRIALLYSSLEVDNVARQAAEHSARVVANDLAITLNSIADAVLAADTAGRLVRLNPAAASLLGVAPAEAVGRPVSDLFRLVEGGDRQLQPNPVDQVLASGRVCRLPDGSLLIRGDGTERQVAAEATPIRDERQVMGGVVLIVRDITESSKLAEQLRRIQKIESMGQLAGGVAHDFNNILQVVKANVTFLAEDPYLSAESRQFLNDIGLAANRAADLTRQLLALGRRQTLQVKELDPAELTRSILKLVRRVLGEHIEITFAAAGDLDCVRGDAGQLEQVVLNLCVNARDAMPGGGRLTLSLDNVALGPDQVRAWPWAQAGRFVRLLVTDSGTGIPEEQLARIFEPFYTTKPTGKGSGLGLSVVQGIVQQHEGFINVYSEIGLGTTFHVYLPGQPCSVPFPASDGPASTSVRHPTGNELILLVEDDPTVRQVAQAMLTRHGYRTLVAADGLEACSLSPAQISEVAVAILDVVMPRMGGVEAGRKIQAMRPDLPIILCSGYAGGIDVPELATGWKMLNKPYSQDELLLAIRKALGRSFPV